MGHNITAIIVEGEYDEEIAKGYDLRGIPLDYGFTLFFIDIYYTAYWQHSLGLTLHLKFSPPFDLMIPTEGAIAHIVDDIGKHENKQFALIHTEYFGGGGEQFANIFEGLYSVDREMKTINEALKYLGVKCKEGMDEFDTIGLSEYRSMPQYLNKYSDLCDELGLQ